MSFRRSMEQLRPARTQKTVNIQEKVQILLTESTKFSTSMENIIGSCFEAKNEKELNKFMKTYRGDFNATKSVHQNDVKKLLKFGQKVRGVAGTGKFQTQKSGSITKEWKEWGGKNPTSKTDITLGKLKCSVKNMDGAQLMSGKKGESNATANAASLEVGLKPAQLKKLTDAISKLEEVTTEGWFASVENLKQLQQAKGNGTLLKMLQDKEKKYKKDLAQFEKDYKKGKVKKKDKPKDLTADEKKVLANPKNAKEFPTVLKGVNKQFVQDMEGEFKDNQDNLKNILENLFKNNDDYKLAFVHEAATGNYKFGKNTQQAASHVLGWRKTPSIENFDIKVVPIKTRNSTAIKTYANQIDLQVNWKSSSKANHQGYNAYQNIRIGLGKITNQRKEMNENFCNELEQYQMQLNEGILNEFNFLSKLKNLVSSFVEKAKELWNKFTNFFKAQILRIIEVAKQGVTALSNSLGFEVETTDTLLNNNKLVL